MSQTLQKMKKDTLQLRKSKSALGPTMQMHLSEIANIAKSDQKDVTEDKVVQYLKSALKRLDANSFSDEDEKSLLKSYLPQMTPLAEVLEFVKTLDDKSKGAVMKAVRAKYGALVDMKELSQNI